ncbi:hypothetical protein DACRYDRAFT_100043 [Dacryopinax primogenitus]|uniref:Uncharacterized protein n=1 Tax=Dacryopinax primogenitus (strain DJM 731) TaxID=1858805 RepID=M5G9C2_DACPD|nr:uncharacterized protein DACRYDRAFT_100043 [Dacryopinax primogenitus]EJU02462.1 hypothetical protein DACRYDRAFT_100043 [Dacryopinax primogenitus]
MATLTRPLPTEHEPQILSRQSIESLTTLIREGVPAPFPHVSELREAVEEEEPVAYVDLTDERIDEPVTPEALRLERREEVQSADSAAITAIYDLQSSVISSLQQILLPPSARSRQPSHQSQSHAHTLLRRHSMPFTGLRDGTPEHQAGETSSPLRGLLVQLALADDSTMQEIPASAQGVARELRRRITDQRECLSLRDYQLANALCSLASDLLDVDELTRPDLSIVAQPLAPESVRSPADAYDALLRGMSALDAHLVDAQSLPLAEHSPVALVQRELLWNRIDRVVADIRELVREPADPFASINDFHLNRFSIDTMPPEYAYDSKDSEAGMHELPAYEPSDYIYTSFAEKPRRQLDMDDIEEAIDHFNRNNPQLVNQRYVVDPGRAERMEMARLVGAVEKLVASGRLDDQRAVRSAVKGKERAVNPELEDGRLWELIEKATSRRMENQSVEIKGGMELRLAKAEFKEKAKKVEFMTTLVQHSSAGRMTSQDAIMRPNIRDPDALLTFPEFIRESAASSRTSQPFLKQEFAATEPEFGPMREPTNVWSRKRGRDRSASAPPLAWLMAGKDVKDAKVIGMNGVNGKVIPESTLSVFYVAEHLSRLRKVSVTFSTAGLPPRAGIFLAEVLPQSPNEVQLSAGEVRATIKLPVSAQPSKQHLRYQDKSCTFSLPTLASSSSPTPQEGLNGIPERLLDAATLASLAPTAFTCASCSLHLVRGSSIARYNDLPSEYWTELVDAWMCHAEQPVPDAAKSEHGLTPADDQALVGGSYVLFNQEALVEQNIRRHANDGSDEPWTAVRCLCGQIIGRATRGSVTPVVYRFTKYGIRPIGTSVEPPRIPVCAYVVQDMRESVEAHACYHFILNDEQESRPRILIWLFNSSVDLSWSCQKSYFLPKNGSCAGALVFYKMIGPSMDPNEVINEHPEFLQAQYLYYPIDICRRLAALLRESHNAYADGASVKGLGKAWLARE